MSELFEVTILVGGVWMMVAGYQIDNCVEEVIKVMALVKDGQCNKYVELLIGNKKDFKKYYEDEINEALLESEEEEKRRREDLAFDAWREEQALAKMEGK